MKYDGCRTTSLRGSSDETFLNPAAAPVLLSMLSGSQLTAQIMHIIDAPFTATLSYTRDGGKTYLYTQLARASNASTYMALKTAAGRTIRITIEDVPNNRTIVLFPQPPSYTYWIEPAPSGKFRVDSIENYRGMLQRGEDAFVQRPDRDRTDGTHHHETALGVRNENGMTLFGSRDELTTMTGDKTTVEAWRSDFGINISIKSYKPTTGETMVSAVTDLRHVEPDPSLFEIPAEYLPHHDPLLDAKSVFIENQTREPEVTVGAGRVLNDWKRLTLTTSRENADLIAVFQYTLNYDVATHRAKDNPVLAANPSIGMKLYVQGSNEPVFTSHLLVNLTAPVGNNRPREDMSAAMGCVVELWNRIANTHVGLKEAPHPVIDAGAR